METFGWVMMCLIGLVAGIAGARLHVKVAAVHRWPVARARVISKGAAAQTAAVPSEPGYRWNVAVKYRYAVNGVEYESDRYAPYVTGRSRADAEKRAAAIPDETDIRYDPNDPSVSYLDPGSTFAAWIAIGAGLIFFPIGALMLIAGL